MCPFLLRVFVKPGSHHRYLQICNASHSLFRIDDYAIRGKEPADEIQIYTWKDATLRELSDLIKDVNEDARRPSARLSFSIVYPDERGRNVLRSIGNVCRH